MSKFISSNILCICVALFTVLLTPASFSASCDDVIHLAPDMVYDTYQNNCSICWQTTLPRDRWDTDTMLYVDSFSYDGIGGPGVIRINDSVIQKYTVVPDCRVRLELYAYGFSGDSSLLPVTLGASVNGSPVPSANVAINAFCEWDITEFFNGWKNGSIPNNGIVIGPPAPACAVLFYSSEVSAPTLRPSLKGIEEQQCQETGAEIMRQYPDNKSIDALSEPFRGNVVRFLAALLDAKDEKGFSNPPNIIISETYREPARAYLMHFSYIISHSSDLVLDGEGTLYAMFDNEIYKILQPNEVNPPVPELGKICWAHKDQQGELDQDATVKAAKDMVQVAGRIVRMPAYPSNHQYGEAIDMTITWDKDLVIPIGFATFTIKNGPKDGGHNKVLHAIGAQFGVIHYLGEAKGRKPDPPHWSLNGY